MQLFQLSICTHLIISFHCQMDISPSLTRSMIIKCRIYRSWNKISYLIQNTLSTNHQETRFYPVDEQRI